MESWVQLPPAHGYASPRTMKVRGLVQWMVSTSDGRDWTYRAHEGSGQEHPLAGGSGTDTGGRRSRGGDQLLPRVRERISSGDGAGEREARCGRVGRPPAAHVLRHVREAELGGVQVHEEADEVRGREEVGGILLHHLHLLSTNKGGVANLHGLGPSGPGQRG